MPFLAINQLPATHVQWIWRLAYGHLAILDGDPGLGKSLVTVDLCARITTGRSFPDGTPGGSPAPVIIINAEDGARDTIQGRLRAADADLSRVFVFERSHGEAFLRLPGQIKRLEEAVARTGARYVVLDPIMSFLDSGVNIANDASVRNALAPLVELAARHHCVVQMVRHLNKGSGTNALYRGLYSIGFIASCRVGWLVARDPHVTRQFILAQLKNNLDPPQPSLAYTIESADSGIARIAWRGESLKNDRDLLAGTPGRMRQRIRAQEFLLDFLKDGPRTTREIWAAAKPLALAPRTLQRACKHLDIRSFRVHDFTPQQAYYWLLPSQKVAQIAGVDASSLALEKLHEHFESQCPESTPLDEENVRVR